MENRKKALMGRGCLLLCTLLWGSSFVILKNTLDYLPTLYILALRFSGAALVLLLLCAKELKKLDRRALGGGLLMGLCLFAAYTFQTYGLEHTTPGVNAFLTASYCVIVPFLYWAMCRRRPDVWNISAAVICIAGMGLVSLKGGFQMGLGEGLTLCCGLFYALHIVISARCLERSGPMLLTLIQFATVAVLGWLGVLLFDAVPRGPAPPSAWGGMVYLTFLCTAVCLLFQTIGQKHTPPAAAAVILTLESVFGTALSILFYGERPSLRLCVGFALIFASILVSETKLEFLRRRLPAAGTARADRCKF